MLQDAEQGTYTVLQLRLILKTTWLIDVFKIDKSALKMMPGITTGNHCF